MPAVQYDYDGYDYIVRKSSTAKKTSVSTPKNSSSRGYAPQGIRTSSAQRATSSRSTTARTTSAKARVATSATTRTTTRSANVDTKKSTATRSNSKVEAVRNANRASVRAIMAENGGTTTKRKTTTTARRKTSNKNLEVPSMLKTKAAKPKEMSLKHAEKVTAPKTKAKSKSVAKKKESVLKTIAYSMCAFSMLFLICYRSSAINESFNALSGIKAELETANTVNAQLESEIETQTDLSNIETYAKYQLGMQKPKDSQIKRIVVTKEDKISTPVVIESEESSFLSDLWHDIVNILD